MKKYFNVLFLTLSIIATNAHALASQIPGTNIIKVSGNYGNVNGFATFSYNPSQIKGVGIETVLGKNIAFNFPNYQFALAPIIIFKNGKFQDVLFGIYDDRGIQDTFGNGGAIWTEVNIRTTCPTQCAQYNLQWRDQTATKNGKGTCLCEPIPAGKQILCKTFDAIGEPIGSNLIAPTICPFTCDTQHAKWNGQWNGDACGCVVCGYIN